MADSAIPLSTDVGPEDRAAVIDGLVAFNKKHGYTWPWRSLEYVLRDAEGRVVGGVLAQTNVQWCYVKALWVADEYRGRRYGSQLLAAAETAARERGCIGIYLDTMSFQARPFYERHGYSVFGVLPDMPPGGAQYYLAKRLDVTR